MKKDAKPTRIRYSILAVIFINVVINYMDRSNISVAAPFILKYFSLDTVRMGYIFSAFGWTYAFLQIPGGILTDRFGPRILYSISLILWSFASLLQGFAGGFAKLLGLRIAIGAFEAPAYPMNNRLVTTWFPDGERASAIAIYTSGQFIGLAFLTPVLLTLEHFLGWQGLFYCTGGIGLVWGIVWWFIYRDPLQHPRVNRAELEHIEKGGGLIHQNEKSHTKFEWKNLRAVLSNRKLWGIYIGQFG
ncbi:MAG TPA: MFS transporter, partial [Puia sp.]